MKIPAYTVSIPRGEGSRTIAWEADGTSFCMTYAPGQGVSWERSPKYDTPGAPVGGAGVVVWLADASTRFVTLMGVEEAPHTAYDPDAMLAEIERREVERLERVRQAKVDRLNALEQQKRDAMAYAKRLEREAKAERDALEG